MSTTQKHTQQPQRARTTLELPGDHMELVRKIAKAQHRKPAQQFRAIVAEYLASHDDTGAPRPC